MKTIKQTIEFKGSVDDVYDAIINPRKLSKITGAKAANTMKIGGKFSAWDDYIWELMLSLFLEKRLCKNGLVLIFLTNILQMLRLN